MRKLFITLAQAALVAVSIASAPPADASILPRAETLGECAGLLADTLAAQLGAKPRKIAVTPFIRLNAGEVVLGAHLADELDTALFQRARKLTLVERRRLDAAIAELRLGAGDLFEADNLRRIGRFLGADAVIVGSIYEADALHVVARVIRVETGDVLAAAEATLAPKPAYRKALGEPLRAAEPPRAAEPKLTTAKAAPPPKQGVIFREDFKALKEGTAPAGWLGTEHFAVVHDKRGTPVFQAFEPGPARFVIPGISLPTGNFVIEWIVSRSHMECLTQPNMFVTIGNLTAGAERRYCTEYQAVLNNSVEKFTAAVGSPHRFELKRDGEIFSLWVDGSRVLLVRKVDFQADETLVLNMDSDSKYLNAGVLYSITVRAVE